MSLLYSILLIHGFLPDRIMVTIIAPMIKNKAGNLSDNNNYRHIALATVASKLFEILILSRVSILLATCANQFGFKKDHSTEMLIIIIIIRQLLCPVFVRRPQHAVSKLPCLVLSSAISCRSSICPGRLSTASLFSLVVFSCHMVSKR